MERRANPFGIAPGDLLMPAVLVIGGMVLLSKLKDTVKDQVPFTSPVFGPSDPPKPATWDQLATIQDVRWWPPMPMVGSELTVTVTIQHIGPSERLTLGIEIGASGGRQLIEDRVPVTEDSLHSYQYTFSFSGIIVLQAGSHNTVAYIRRENGTELDRRSWGNLIVSPKLW